MYVSSSSSKDKNPTVDRFSDEILEKGCVNFQKLIVSTEYFNLFLNCRLVLYGFRDTVCLASFLDDNVFCKQ